MTIDGTPILNGSILHASGATCSGTVTQVYNVQSGPHQVNVWLSPDGVNEGTNGYPWVFPNGLTNQTVTVNVSPTVSHGVNVTCNGTSGSNLLAIATAY